MPLLLFRLLLATEEEIGDTCGGVADVVGGVAAVDTDVLLVVVVSMLEWWILLIAGGALADQTLPVVL